MRFQYLISVVVVAGLLFGIAFWRYWGHELHYNVYSDDVFWYREEFPDYLKVILTSLLGVTFGLVVAAITRLVDYIVKGS